MNAEFTSIIQTLIAERGKDAVINPAKCKMSLPDYTKGEYAKERRHLLTEVETGAAREIAAAANLDICKKQQIRHLKEDLFMAEDVAADAIDLLAFVLRRDTGRTILETPKPAPPKPKEAPAAANKAEAERVAAERARVEAASQKTIEALYNISINYQQSGPFSLKQLENMISSQRVSKNYRIRPVEKTNWIPIIALPELKPFFENVPQPAPAVKPMPAKNDPVKEARTQTAAAETQENKQETAPDKSKYKHSRVKRVVLTLCSFVLVWCLWMMPAYVDWVGWESDLVTFLYLLITFFLPLIGIGKLWEKIKK
jgi:hypothetical protein